MCKNRIWMIPVLLVVTLSLWGCMDVQDLTDEEGNMVAEYSAGVLLRYSEQYERRLVTKEQREEKKPEETAVPSAVAPASPTPAPMPSSGDGRTGQQETADKVSLNDLYDMKGIDFSYQSYQFYDRYPNNDNSIASVVAGKDEILLVVSFQIHNQSGTDKKVSLGKRAEHISYTLTVDGEEYQPGITILENTGLNFLNTTIKKGGKEEAVLVYTMAKERKRASSISLRIQEGNKAADIPLK